MTAAPAFLIAGALALFAIGWLLYHEQQQNKAEAAERVEQIVELVAAYRQMEKRRLVAARKRMRLVDAAIDERKRGA